MPDSLKYMLILLVVGGIAYGGAWYLANFPPGPDVISKPVKNDKLRN